MVLKIPNVDVFRIARPNLIAKGISRIVCAENLIALWAILYSFINFKINKGPQNRT